MGIYKRLFGSWHPSQKRWRTCVTPKKGMLVAKEIDWYHYFMWGEENKPEHVLIVGAVCDEYGQCKFQFLGAEKTEWTAWMPVREFNERWRIKNPWI